jgi:hypothetical protein
MRSILVYLLMLLSIGAQAAPRDTARIETRYGIVDVASHGDSVDIRFQGKVVSSVEASGASLYRVTPKGQGEFVIVDALTSGLHCHHVYVLLELSDDGSVIASNPFGACKELEGVDFRGESPLIHLGEPAVAGDAKSAARTDFEWRDGNVVQVSGQAPVKADHACALAAEAAKTDSPSVDTGERMVKVVGRGRLQFLSALRAGCDQPGVFVIAGDSVRASRRFDIFTFVHYVNPKSARSVQGWVLSSRLAEAPAP